VQGTWVRFGPLDLPESRQLRLARLYPGTVWKGAVRTALVPKPDLRDTALLSWCRELLDTVTEPILTAGGTTS
jgi:transcription-repair coupling factor (superfamily II helicase)